MVRLPPLLKPIDYLRIKHPYKIRYDLFAPLCLAAPVLLLFVLAPEPVPVFGESGLLSIFIAFLPILTGFYIAALAAIATFDKPSMDRVMPGSPPMTLLIERLGVQGDEELTRRRFLCLMFGYLSFLGFLLFGVSAFSNLFAENIQYVALHLGGYFASFRFLCIACYLFVVSHLLAVTFWGLYYLTDRIHRGDGVVHIKE
jgi:hypothetical protein